MINIKNRISSEDIDIIIFEYKSNLYCYDIDTMQVLEVDTYLPINKFISMIHRKIFLPYNYK